VTDRVATARERRLSCLRAGRSLIGALVNRLMSSATSPFVPRERRYRLSARALVAVIVAGIGGLGTLRGAVAPVARWSFEAAAEPTTKRHIVIAPTATLGPGKSGRALWPRGRSDGPAGAARATSALRIEAPAANPTDARLNLGAEDWTLDGWLWLAADGVEEGTIFEIGSGPPAANELVTRFSVLPRENAFVFAGLSPVIPGEPERLGREVEFANPEGPPTGLAWLEQIVLPLAGRTLPRGKWFHVALVHEAAERALRLYIDGRIGAVAAARLMALPRGEQAYVSIGCDAAGGRVVAGAIDELQVSDRVLPAEPGSR
jgi:hypothetical protein